MPVWEPRIKVERASRWSGAVEELPLLSGSPVSCKRISASSGSECCRLQPHHRIPARMLEKKGGASHPDPFRVTLRHPPMQGES
ncbi:hypothetical protein AUP68_14455 [Ilyonectria robusta]